MAEPHNKRSRDDSEPLHAADSSSHKRHNSAAQSPALESPNPNQLPETETETEPSTAFLPQDLYAFDFDFIPAGEEGIQTETTTTDSTTCSSSDEDDGGVNSVMRRLLEASDDELGIPNYGEVNCVENCPLDFEIEGLWEFEDVAAGYYVMLQEEFF